MFLSKRKSSYESRRCQGQMQEASGRPRKWGGPGVAGSFQPSPVLLVRTQGHLSACQGCNSLGGQLVAWTEASPGLSSKSMGVGVGRAWEQRPEGELSPSREPRVPQELGTESPKGAVKTGYHDRSKTLSPVSACASPSSPCGLLGSSWRCEVVGPGGRRAVLRCDLACRQESPCTVSPWPGGWAPGHTICVLPGTLPPCGSVCGCLVWSGELSD